MFKKIQMDQFGGPEVLRQIEVQTIQPLCPGQLRIKMHYAGVNRADLLLRTGNYHIKTVPITPGLEGAGVVIESMGSLPVGERVCVFKAQSGMYSQEVIVEEDCVLPIPGAIPLEAAAALPLNWLTAYDCLTRLLAVQPGQDVLVFAAASGVGQAALQLVAALGAKAYAVVSTHEKANFLRESYGVQVLPLEDNPLLTVDQRLDAWQTDILKIKGFDKVFDLLGGPFFRFGLKALKPGGSLAQAANPTLEDTTFNVRDFYPRNISIHGFQYGNLSAIGRDKFKSQLGEIFNLYLSKRIKDLPRKIFRMDDVGQAHIQLQERANIGKILINLRDDV